MTTEQMQATPHLKYEVWNVQSRKDCEIEDKLFALDSIGEFTLKLLWEGGVADGTGHCWRQGWFKPELSPIPGNFLQGGSRLTIAL